MMRTMIRWAAAAVAVVGAVTVAGFDSPARAEVTGAKTLILETSAGRVWSGPIANVVLGTTGGHVFVLVVAAGNPPAAVCGIDATSMSEALLLRAQILDPKTTSVDCTDNALARTTSITITTPTPRTQSLRLNGI